MLIHPRQQVNCNYFTNFSRVTSESINLTNKCINKRINKCTKQSYKNMIHDPFNHPRAISLASLSFSFFLVYFFHPWKASKFTFQRSNSRDINSNLLILSNCLRGEANVFLFSLPPFKGFTLEMNHTWTKNTFPFCFSCRAASASSLSLSLSLSLSASLVLSLFILSCNISLSETATVTTIQSK